MATVLVLAGCSGGGDSGQPDGPSVGATILEPVDASTDVPTALDIDFSTDNAVETEFELSTLDGTAVDGEFTGSDSWRPAAQLDYETTYVATLTAVGGEGENQITTSTFTTMPEPARTVRVFSYIGSDAVVGVGMPLRIEFKTDDDTPWNVPEEYRAEVERRLEVSAEPEQQGGWRWVSASELHYRPRDFWEPETRINLRATLGGLPVGDGWYLRNDLNVNLSVGREILMTVDNHSRQMVVEIDGEPQRTFPVSLGREDWPSSSGTFVIMEKMPETVFDTREEMGEDGYVVDIEHAMRLTYSGEFIHATTRAPEILGSQNVTHGCINLAPEDAEWLFEQTHRWGDPVIVSGTGSRYEPGDGWTDWNLDWREYQQGSALRQG